MKHKDVEKPPQVLSLRTDRRISANRTWNVEFRNGGDSSEEVVALGYYIKGNRSEKIELCNPQTIGFYGTVPKGEMRSFGVPVDNIPIPWNKVTLYVMTKSNKYITETENYNKKSWIQKWYWVLLVAFGICFFAGSLYGYYETYRYDFPQGVFQDKTYQAFTCPGNPTVYGSTGADNSKKEDVFINCKNLTFLEYPIAGQLKDFIISDGLKAELFVIPVIVAIAAIGELVLDRKYDKSLLANQIRRRRTERILVIVLSSIVIIGNITTIGGYFLIKNTLSGGVSTKCDIKGNISKNGNKIYHTPQDKSYSYVEINTGSGEKWFCSETEAQLAGWRLPKS